SAEEANKAPRPRIVSAQEQEERQKKPGILDRLSTSIFGESKEKDPTYEDYQGEIEEVPEQDKDKAFVRLWMSVEDPLFFTSDLQLAQRKLGDFDNPTTLRVEEAFMVWFKVCLMCGLVLGSPWIFWQVWMFVAAGLYPSEKRIVHVYLPFSLGLFLGGVIICEWLVIPKAIEALLWFNEWMGMKPDVRLNDWLGFAIWMPV